ARVGPAEQVRVFAALVAIQFVCHHRSPSPALAAGWRNQALLRKSGRTSLPSPPPLFFALFLLRTPARARPISRISTETLLFGWLMKIGRPRRGAFPPSVFLVVQTQR